MSEITFKGRRYFVRGFSELRGSDWLHVAVIIENGQGDGAILLESIQSSIAVLVPSASTRMRRWPPQDVLDFSVIVYREVSASLAEGPMVIGRFGDALERLMSVIKERYGVKEGPG